jgi:pilus assembly protein Flp/PilA
MLYLYAKLQTMWATRDQGASAVEYGLLVAAIAAVIVGIAFVLGGHVLTAFTHTSDCIAGKGTGPAGGGAC